MARTGLAHLPLHPGKCPPWLFKRMKGLAGSVTDAIVLEYSQEEFLRRLSDPFWFQAFGCVLGFDWNSSGLTTTVAGALKEALDPEQIGLAVCGGKGRVSRKAPSEILEKGDIFNLSSKRVEELKYSSKMSSKIDSAVLQDNYQLYHHVFIFSEKGSWTVVQQGLNPGNKYARRYHWLSDDVRSFVEEPHKAICCDSKEKRVLDMTSRKSREAQKISLDLVKDNPSRLQRYFNSQTLIDDFLGKNIKILNLPSQHEITHLKKQTLISLQKAWDIQPESYEELVSLRGIGPKSVRALALVSELVYGKPPSWSDPAKFAFAHGGKDGYPRPVDRDVMDRSIGMLRTGIENAKLGNREKLGAIKRLHIFI